MRKIEDFVLPKDEKKTLARPEKEVYIDLAAKVGEDLAATRVPIIMAAMGWGKTTYFLIHLHQKLRKDLVITLPTIKLA